MDSINKGLNLMKEGNQGQPMSMKTIKYNHLVKETNKIISNVLDAISAEEAKIYHLKRILKDLTDLDLENLEEYGDLDHIKNKIDGSISLLHEGFCLEFLEDLSCHLTYLEDVERDLNWEPEE